MRYYLLIIFSLVCLNLHAHSFQKLIHLTTHNGLSGNRAWHAFEDSKGFIWISTTDGLSRYDGHSFKNYFSIPGDSNSLCGNVIANVQERSDGKILIATSHGVSEYDPAGNSFRTVFVPPAPASEEYAVGIGQILVDHHDRLWIATQHAVYCLDSVYQNMNFPYKNLYGNSYVFRIEEDSNGNVWINKSNFLNRVTVDGKIFSVQNYNTDPGKEVYSFSCIDFLVNPYNEIVTLSHDQEIIRFDKSGHATVLFKLITDERINYFGIAWSSGNNIWLTTSSDGVFKYNLSGQMQEHFFHVDNQPGSLCWNDVKDIVEDNNGNTWLCTDGGLDVLPLTKINAILVCGQEHDDSSVINKEPLNTFLITDTSVWCAEWGGSICEHQIQSGKNHWYSTGPQDGYNYIFDLLDVGGKLWFGTFSGLYYLDPVSGRIAKIRIPVDGIFATDTIPVTGFFRDKNKFIWISLGKGLGVLQTDSLFHSCRHFSLNQPGENNFPFRNFTSIAEDATGRVWMGHARSKGIAIFDYSTGSFRFNRRKKGTGFDEQVNYFFATKNYMWVGTNSGVFKLDMNTYVLKQFSRQNGLPSNNINSISTDAQMQLWIATVNGLSLLDSSETRIVNFKSIDGIPEDEISALHFDNQRNIIYGLCTNVLFSFHPDSVIKSSRPVRPVLLSLKVMGKEVALKENKILEVDYLDKYITIEYTTPVFGVEDRLFYSYKLEGYDTNWIYLGQHQSIGFTDLPTGSYHFRLRVSSDGTHWQESSSPIDILVNAPYYKKPWFIVLEIFLLLLLIVSIIITYYRVKLSRLLLAQKIRNKIANDLHDDIGSSLSSISYMTELVKMKSGKQESGSDSYLNRIGETSRRLIDNMSDIVWSVNPENDAAESLIQRMKYFVAENLKLKEIHYTFDVEPGTEAKKFTMEERRNLYLIFKEMMHNILKHSQCTRVEIQISSSRERISISVRDNGIGFNTENKYEGNGLKNMQKRSFELGAELTIQSAPGSGSHFVLSL